MLKSIKNSVKYLIIIVGIFIAVSTLLSFVLRVPGVQTIILKRITTHLSDKQKSTISVGRVEFRFFKRLMLNDILIKDRNNDTLFYSEAITLGIKNLSTGKKIFAIGSMEMKNPVIALITDTAGVMNLKWYLDMLKSADDTVKKPGSTITINRLEIENANFSLVNRQLPGKKSGIDFNNLHLSGINGTIEDIFIHNDTASLVVNKLSFTERGGFSLKKLKSNLLYAGSTFELKSTYLDTDSSSLDIPRLQFRADTPGIFRNFINNTSIDMQFGRSLVSSNDIRYFVPVFKALQQPVWITGRFYGTIPELRGRSISIDYGDHTFLDCDFSISGLPKIENSFIYLGINNLRTSINDIERIKLRGNNKIVIPDFLDAIDTISVKGSFTGFPDDFVAYCNLETDKGTVSTDISFRPEKPDRFKINGIIEGRNISIGEITGNTDMLGSLSMRTNFNGYAYSLERFSGDLSGLIDSVEVNHYIYRNIALNGYCSEKAWDGKVKITDKNMAMDILGLFNFTGNVPEFDFKLNLARANLNKLNFDKNDTTSSLSMSMTANFTGNNIDNLDGEIKLLLLNINKNGNALEVKDFSVRTFTENNLTAIKLRSDFVDADINGYYNFAGLGLAFKSAMASIMPSRFHPPSLPYNEKKNNFTFNVNFKNSDRVNNFFRSGILISEKSSLTGIVSPDSIMNVKGIFKSLNIRKNLFRDLNFEASLVKTGLNLKLKSSSLSLLGHSRLEEFAIDLKAIPDNFLFEVSWNNEESELNRGNIVIRGKSTSTSVEELHPVLSVEIDSSVIYSRDTPWKISHSTLVLDTSAIRVNNLFISNNNHYYRVDGSVSENPADTLSLEFRGIDIEPLNSLVSRKDTSSKIPLSIKGVLDGNIKLTNMYRNPMFESDLRLLGFSILGSEYGDIAAISVWNSERKVAEIRAGNNLDGKKMLDISGYYDPALRKLNLLARADKLHLDALNPLLGMFASGIKGSASGRLDITGESGKIALTGALMAENTSITIDYLQAKYMLNDTVRFNRNSIFFRDAKLQDENKNTATLNGTIKHTYFKDFIVDLAINTSNCLVLETTSEDNEMFYGTAFTSSGVTSIKSTSSGLSFDIYAQTGRNNRTNAKSELNIPLNSGETISDYSFITFLKPDTAQKLAQPLSGSDVIAPKKSGIDLTLDLAVTPDARVKLIFDSKLGDEITASGSGKLNINLNKRGEFNIAGDYIIEEGDYLFTLGNIFNKHFDIGNDGKIMFNGNIENAEIELEATYNKFKTSLFPILQDEKYNERIFVEPKIYLTGKLFNPIVKFEINLPDADEATRTYLKNAITSEEELNRQFLYLIVTNSFYTNQAYGTALSSTATGTSTMVVTTAEMLSNQLSNWVSKISKTVDLGFIYRPGFDLNPQEVDLALSTQLLNDKVMINVNGNFDVREPSGTSGNNNSLTGDFDVEYKLTDKIRFKAFNRYNNPYAGKLADYTQGFGFLFKQDFNKFSDFIRRKDKSPMKKEKPAEIPGGMKKKE